MDEEDDAYPIVSGRVADLPPGYVLVLYWRAGDDYDDKIEVHVRQNEGDEVGAFRFLHAYHCKDPVFNRLLALVKLMGVRTGYGRAPYVYFDSLKSYKEFCEGKQHAD